MLNIMLRFYLLARPNMIFHCYIQEAFVVYNLAL